MPASVVPRPSECSAPRGARQGGRGRRSFGRLAACAVAVLVGFLALGAGTASTPALVSFGVFRMGADALWKRGIRGQGQTVCILDQGFGGLDASIAAGILPPRSEIVTKSFDTANGLDGRDVVGNPTQHGVRVAEIVHSVAPDARLVLVNYHTRDEFVGAVNWIISQHIPIVNHSNSFLTPPYNDTGFPSRAIDRAARHGVLWVNSAGNFGLRHWAGIFTDRNGNNRNDFGGGDAMPLPGAQGQPIFFVLSWSSSSVKAGYAMLVQRQTGSGWTTVYDAEPDHGEALVSYRASKPGPYKLVVARRFGPAVALNLFSRTLSMPLGFRTLRGSIPTPGDARGALTVGAAVADNDNLAGYSSNGPTSDGRPKPDVVGPTDVTVNPAFRGEGGTSTAAPHVAAAAALLRQLRQAAHKPADPATLKRLLTGDALDLGPRGPDPGYGAGRVRLELTPPHVVVQVEPSAPRPAVRISPGSQPVLRVTVTDDGTPGAIRILEGGRLLTTGRGALLRFRVPVLSNGVHKITVQANDLAGNGARTAVTLVVRPG